MKGIKHFVICLFLVIGLSNLSGCAIGVIAAGVGLAKSGTAKNRQAYNQYVAEMNEANFKREKAGFKPEPVLSYKEYLET